jgi:DNA-binding beta-propeller fold protein YncE
MRLHPALPTLHRMCRRSLRSAAWTFAVAATTAVAQLQAPLQPPVERLAVLPPDVRHPEGLAADPATHTLYVGTFDARTPATARNNQVLRYSADGALLARRSFGEAPLTGLAVAGGKLYILNFGAARLQRLPLDFSSDSPVEDVVDFGALAPAAPPPRRVDNPDGSHDTVAFGAAGHAAINGMVFDRAGNLYVSDSFQGAVYRIEQATRCAPCRVTTLMREPLLATAGALPFGANGLAFNADESVLYINNAGDGRVLRMALPGGPLQVLAESIHGADGLLFHDGLLWVAANQADAVLALDEQGRTRVRAGAFLGIDADGAPNGLLFPASTAVLGDWMVVSNLALPLTPAAGDEWEEDVRRWTLSRFRIPNAGR